MKLFVVHEPSLQPFANCDTKPWYTPVALSCATLMPQELPPPAGAYHEPGSLAPTAKVVQLAPRQPPSQTHAPDTQSPFNEQSQDELHGAPPSCARATARDKTATSAAGFIVLLCSAYRILGLSIGAEERSVLCFQPRSGVCCLLPTEERSVLCVASRQ